MALRCVFQILKNLDPLVQLVSHIDPVLVVDTLGAGRGDKVMITSDGIGARELLGDNTSPVRWSVLGILD